jgi:hypothetical protein
VPLTQKTPPLPSHPRSVASIGRFRVRDADVKIPTFSERDCPSSDPYDVAQAQTGRWEEVFALDMLALQLAMDAPQIPADNSDSVRPRCEYLIYSLISTSLGTRHLRPRS